MEEASTAEAAAFIVAASSIAAATEAVVVVTAVAAALIPSTVDCRASARSTGSSEHNLLMAGAAFVWVGSSLRGFCLP